ncbi:MAG: hypothetical protein O7I93_11820 [Gemmatimonadetes bacterium]|nr:hypothetical protein [Gemmatimonadota bacterium]
MIFATRRLIRSVGWLLTPLAAWAFSFLGAWVGARFGRGVESPRWGLTLLVLGAVFGAVLGAGLWVWALRRAWHSALRLKRERLTRERALKRESEQQQEQKT